MSEVISISVRAEAAWSAYVAAAQRAQQSHALGDGIEAGKAWRRFLDTFLSPHQRDALHGDLPACK